MSPSPSPRPPRPLWQTSRTLKHIRSCYSGDKLTPSAPDASLSEAKKHRELGSFFLPHPSPPFIYFTGPLCLSQSVEGAHCIPLRCLSVCCCSPVVPCFPSQPPTVFVYISVCTKWTKKKTRAASRRLTVLIRSCLLSFWLRLPLSLRTWNTNQRSMDLESLSYEKAHASTTKHGFLSWKTKKIKKKKKKKH